MDIAGNMLGELAHIHPVTDFAAQRVLTLQYNRIAFSQLKHECKTLVESRIINFDRFHIRYHRWFSPFFKMCNADQSSGGMQHAISGI
jgi:ATP-dependent exoDNAse (exonuclease V) beta subunit